LRLEAEMLLKQLPTSMMGKLLVFQKLGTQWMPLVSEHPLHDSPDY
jgi:hypothetical protein